MNIDRIGAGRINISWDKQNYRVFSFPITTRIKIPYYVQCLRESCAENQVFLPHHIYQKYMSCFIQICFVDNITQKKSIEAIIPSRQCGSLNFHIFHRLTKGGLVNVQVAFHGTIILLMRISKRLYNGIIQEEQPSRLQMH